MSKRGGICPRFNTWHSTGEPDFHRQMCTRFRCWVRMQATVRQRWPGRATPRGASLYLINVARVATPWKSTGKGPGSLESMEERRAAGRVLIPPRGEKIGGARET